SWTIMSKPFASAANNSQNSNGKEGFAWYHLDRYLTKNGEVKHPITEIIEYLMIPDSEWKRINLRNTETAHILANDRCFERTSPFLIEPGTDVDLSDLVVKNNYD
ncbi:9232_t:CDS:2, partial [Cetraspora pellucida]